MKTKELRYKKIVFEEFALLFSCTIILQIVMLYIFLGKKIATVCVHNI